MVIVALSTFVLSFVIVNASYQDWVLYSDNYRESLDEIKDNPDFRITIWSEYFFIVENKKNWEEVKVNISPENIDDFENYSSDALGIELNHMVPRSTIKITYDENKSKREVETDQQMQTTNLSNTWNNAYKVTFNANGWIWDNEITEDVACLYKLPESKFTPEKWKEFKWWSTSTDWPVISEDTITISGDTTLYAIWDNDCKNAFYNCPDGAMCSSVMCNWVKKRRVERCQDGYEMENWQCKCYTKINESVVLDWTYSCDRCPYGDKMCFLDVWAKRENFTLDNFWAEAAWIDNIEDLRVKIRTLDGAWNYLWLYWGDNSYYFKHSVCESIWEQYFSEAGKELSIEYVSDSTRNCKRGCKCVDINDCPESDRSACLQDKESWKRFDLSSDRVCPSVWGCKETPSGWKCTTYSKNKSYECSKYEKVSTCIKWIRDRDPREYGSCSLDALLDRGDNDKIPSTGLGEHHENKGWKCYKINDGMEESDECDCDNYVNKSKDWTWLTSTEPGCSVDTYMCESETTGEKFYSGVCGACGLGYEMREPGKCEFIPCGPDFWMEAQMNIGCPEDAWKYGITCDDEYMKSTKEFVPMNGCTQAGKQVCEKHYGSDAYVGNQKWLKGLGYGDERDGCTRDYAHTYFKCTECEGGYTLKNGACVADSGVGSIYYYKGDENKPIGIVFEETDDTIKIVSLYDLGGIKYDYSRGFTPYGTYYFWEDAIVAAKQYAPKECEVGSFCGKGKWRIPTREEMQVVSKNFADWGPLVQAIRWLEASCSKENSMNLLTHRYWTSTSVTSHTNVESVYGGADINAAYVVYHPIGNVDYPDSSGKKNSIQPSEQYARPVLTIYK